jgi:hypothetical protein
MFVYEINDKSVGVVTNGTAKTCMECGPEEDRTPDLRIANATLSQLSYRPIEVVR